MAYYFIAQIDIHDKVEYQLYLDGSESVFKQFKGEYLAVDNNPAILEGNWSKGRTVLIKFPTKSDFEEWYYSKYYQDLLKHRLKASFCNSILVEGK